MKEKVAVLIDKLQKLKNEDADISELSHYTKLLYAELMCAKSERDKQQCTKKVAVIMPGYAPRNGSQNEKPLPSENGEKVRESVEVSTEVKKEITAEPVAYETAPNENAQATLWEEKPATAEQNGHTNTSHKELNDLIAEKRPSLNDQLKTEREEVASRIGNRPIHNLHQAIGLNEKFGFINELFRGDQSLYDRSIKTINDCKDLDEALYWIDRELKIKLGWQEKNKTVQRFYDLIRKRFS